MDKSFLYISLKGLKSRLKEVFFAKIHARLTTGRPYEHWPHGVQRSDS